MIFSAEGGKPLLNTQKPLETFSAFKSLDGIKEPLTFLIDRIFGFSTGVVKALVFCVQNQK